MWRCGSRGKPPKVSLGPGAPIAVRLGCGADPVARSGTSGPALAAVLNGAPRTRPGAAGRGCRELLAARRTSRRAASGAPAWRHVHDPHGPGASFRPGRELCPAVGAAAGLLRVDRVPPIPLGISRRGHEKGKPLAGLPFCFRAPRQRGAASMAGTTARGWIRRPSRAATRPSPRCWCRTACRRRWPSRSARSRSGGRWAGRRRRSC